MTIYIIYLCVAVLDLLSPRHVALLVRVNEISNHAVEPRLKNNARQRQQREFAVVPAGHAANVNVRVARQFAKLKLLAARHRGGAHPVHRQRGVLVAPSDLHLVPSPVAEVSANGDDLRTAAQVVPQTQRRLHQFYLEEVVCAAVVRVQEQTVALLRLELELQGAVQRHVPSSKLREAARRAVQHEAATTTRGAQQQSDSKQQRHATGWMHFFLFFTQNARDS